MKKRILNILFNIYLVIAIFVTILLLSYNEFKVTEFGNYSLVLITDDGLAPDYNNGDLVIVNKKDPILTGRKAFFYDSYNEQIEIRLGVIEAAEKVNDTEITYTLEGEKKISGQYVLGPSNTTEVIPKVGTILSIVQSKWGFLFLIVLPALVAFVNQIGVVYSGIKDARKEEREEAKKAIKEEVGASS